MRLHGHKKENERLEKIADDSAEALILFLAKAICNNPKALNYAKKMVQENPDFYKPDFDSCIKNSFIKKENFKMIKAMVFALAFIRKNKPKEIELFFLKFFPEAKKLRPGQGLCSFCKECANQPRGTFDFLYTAAVYFSQMGRFGSHGLECSGDEIAATAITHMLKYTNAGPVPAADNPNVKLVAKKMASLPFLKAMSEDDFEDTVNYIYNVMQAHDVTPELLETAKMNARRWEQLFVLIKGADIVSAEDGPDAIKDYLFIGRIVSSLSDAIANERSNAIALYEENISLKKKLDQINQTTDVVSNESKEETDRLLESIRVLQTENDKLQVKLSDAQSELQAANEYIAQVEVRDEVEENQSDSVADSCEKEVDSYPDGTILIGGHGRWQKFFHQKYPNVRIIDGNDRNFNKGMFSAQTPLVLVNTTHLSHACFNRFYSVVKQFGLEVKYIYTSSSFNQD